MDGASFLHEYLSKYAHSEADVWYSVIYWKSRIQYMHTAIGQRFLVVHISILSFGHNTVQLVLRLYFVFEGSNLYFYLGLISWVGCDRPVFVH